MSRYFCLGRLIEIIKERYPKEAKLIICFDRRKSIGKTKSNQLQLHPYGIIVVDTEKKHTVEYSKLLEFIVYSYFILNWFYRVHNFTLQCVTVSTFRTLCDLTEFILDSQGKLCLKFRFNFVRECRSD
jgi:L-cystine uptake protein TcyP (sodium:dicarboxylate symporter family)